MPDLKYFQISFNVGRIFKLMQKTSLLKNAIKMLMLNIEFPALLLVFPSRLEVKAYEFRGSEGLLLKSK